MVAPAAGCAKLRPVAHDEPRTPSGGEGAKIPVPFPMRMPDDEGARLAEMMVSALRDVYGIERVDLLEERESNAFY